MINTPEKFTVAIPDADLGDLKRRLAQTRWAIDFGNEDWRYGVERRWLQDMVDYWKDEFDWRAQEEAMNQWPQYLVEIEGIPIHFVHIRGKGDSTRPLLLSHGWPWTFWDFKDVIGPLTDPAANGNPAAPAFDLVVPSLPGMAFSTPLTQTGVDARRIAHLWTKLMRDVLGYQTFAAAGSDWGAQITTELAHVYPELLTGIWLSFTVFPGEALGPPNPDDFAAEEQWMVDQMHHVESSTATHFAVATHEPQTLSYALVDSPVGTAAWLWDRRRNWSDNGGDVLSVFDRDFLCTTASIYWLTGTIGTSMRIYYEHFTLGPPPPLHDRVRVSDVPTGVAVFPKDNRYISRAKAEKISDLRRWTVMPRGGHYAFKEQPEACLSEMRTFFGGL